MPVQLGEISIDGPSRHRIRKGMLLVSLDRRREANRGEAMRIIAGAESIFHRQELLTDFALVSDPNAPALASLITPFAYLHTPARRAAFFEKLRQALNVVWQVAEACGFFPVCAGIDPFVAAAEGESPPLCPDVHEIEVLDDLEAGRIYNIFRQYLPELIGLSSHSALYGGRLQKDLSTRMRLNPLSFTPPPLLLYSSKQLDRLARDMRKNSGVGDLAQLDLDLTAPGTIALRFVDAQASVRFMRAQAILFQAMAIHARGLARQGSQVPSLRRRVIAENKALAIEAGPGAMLKPDREREVKRESEWYQDRKTLARASTALLQMLRHRTVGDGGSVMTGLRVLNTDYDEIAPWLLGAELRNREQACLVNYGEYQARLFYVARAGWPVQLYTDLKRLVSDPQSDNILEYNLSKFGEMAATIAADWVNRLAITRNTPQPQQSAQQRREGNHR